MYYEVVLTLSEFVVVDDDGGSSKVVVAVLVVFCLQFANRG